MPVTKKTRNKKPHKKKKATSPAGWNTTDEEEIARRASRAAEASYRITSATDDNAIFSDWHISSKNEGRYRVEIRSLTSLMNSCSCKDFQINKLGTCKHIIAVINKLRRRKSAEKKAGHCGIEIYLDRREMRVRASFPQRMHTNKLARQLVTALFDEKGFLRGDILQSMAVFRDKLSREKASVQTKIRISSHLEQYLDQLQRAADQRSNRRQFEQDLKIGRTTLDVTKLPLYPYQQDGTLHLAFTGRALLADEMGLGKTVQAIAASELLDRFDGIEKVLVISPASLKSEWLEQIDTFSHRRALIIQGARKYRYKLYQQPAFYYLANYEQMLYDRDFINNTLQPDLIILDEAQRIKNWKTKTAIAIKQLNSQYAFVLSGTPLENRIDEIYSIAQFLDPGLFGPLFRFNRDFHELDEKGKATGYKNLDLLHEKLRPIMLRRRKGDVEGELPDRSINNYFVELSDEQEDQYQLHKRTVATLSHTEKRRPLTKKERELLMKSLSCMRMACDTPYILDQNIRVSPKLNEFEKILADLLTEPDCKIIVFSEWERMLTLLKERLSKSGIDYAWHAGSISQKRRRDEINRFKQNPECRIFLATDSAATGLNLQNARVVVNLDLPWNPAKLEQRIARAWRKHQKHSVTVISLISEYTIEHRMLSVLQHKTGLADEVLDGAGKTTRMQLSAGKGSFMKQLDNLLQEPEQKRTPFEQFADDTSSSHEDRIEHLEQRGSTLIAIVDKPDQQLLDDMSNNMEKYYDSQRSRLEVLDKKTFETLQRLIAAGVIQYTASAVGDSCADSNKDDKVVLEKKRRENKYRKLIKSAEEKLRMSQLLDDGGFSKESLKPMSDSLDFALAAAAIRVNITLDEPVSIGQLGALLSASKLPGETVALVASLRYERDSLSEDASRKSMLLVQELIELIN